MKYGDIAKELSGIAREQTDLADGLYELTEGLGQITERLNKSTERLDKLAERLYKIETATPVIKASIKAPESVPVEPFQPQITMMTVEEMGEMFGISRQLAYQLARRDDFPTLRIGRRLLIPSGKLIEWVNNHCGQEVIL